MVLRTGKEVKINGDDCAFIADAERYRRWNVLGKLIGLKPSPGKVYCSREFLMMNSETRFRGDSLLTVAKSCEGQRSVGKTENRETHR